MSAARILGALLPLVLLVAVAGVPWMLRRERRRPSVPEHVAQARAWRRLSTVEQAAADQEALGEGAVRESADVVARERAAGAAQVAVERAVEINALHRP